MNSQDWGKLGTEYRKLPNGTLAVKEADGTYGLFGPSGFWLSQKNTLQQMVDRGWWPVA